MVEFAINSSVNATTGYAPFELNHGYMLRSGQHISTDTTFKGVKQFAQQAVWNLLDAHDTILEHRIEQTHYSNKRRKPGVEYQINDLTYLLTKNLALPKHRAQKLMPKFIGPYKILKVMNNSLNITLELSQEFKDRKINPTFHTNLVRPYMLQRWLSEADNGVAKSDGGDVRGTWLQLMCCALPKHLCP